MSGAVTPLLHTPSWRVELQHCICLYFPGKLHDKLVYLNYAVAAAFDLFLPHYLQCTLCFL
jgi:hypothetical protein